jgi:hypothetical protein
VNEHRTVYRDQARMYRRSCASTRSLYAHTAAPPLQSPTKLLAAAKTLHSTGAFGLMEHQLMLADLFKSSQPAIPTGEPKNIDVLQNLAEPLARHRTSKFAEEEEKAREEPK